MLAPNIDQLTVKPTMKTLITRKHCALGQASKAKMQRGFTLIELMVVIVIIGILAGIAVPAYNSSVQKSRRTDAKNGLLDLATREEKFYSVTNNYSSQMSDLYPGQTGTSLTTQTSGTAYYTLSVPTVTAASGASATAAYFQATAVPISGTAQANDACGTFTIDSNGVTSNTGNTATNCW